MSDTGTARSSAWRWRLGPLTPETAPPEEQTWHTYPPVPMPSVDAVVATLTRRETWPDVASELGRFTPLRAGGLAGQTFEIGSRPGARRAAPCTRAAT